MENAARAEVDARGLFARLGYPSLHAYCVEELQFAHDVAGQRIQAARAVREFPTLLDAVEDGRLGLTVLVLVAPRLTGENLSDVLESVAGRSKRDVRAILGQRFPRPLALEAAAAAHEVGAPGADATDRAVQQDPDPVLVPGESAVETLVMVPLSPPVAAAPVRFPLHLAVTQGFRDRLAYARDLLGHALPGGEAADVLERAFGREFMQARRERAARKAIPDAAGRPAPAPQPDPAWRADVVAALRTLGYRDKEVHAALAASSLGSEATVEQRPRAALRYLAPPARKQAPAA